MTLTSVFFDTMEFSISQRTNIFCISFSCSFAEFFHADLCFSSSSLSLTVQFANATFQFQAAASANISLRLLAIQTFFQLPPKCQYRIYQVRMRNSGSANSVCVCVFLSHNFKRFSSHIIIFFRASRENKKVKNGRFYCTKITSVPNTAFTAFHEYIAEACVCERSKMCE